MTIKGDKDTHVMAINLVESLKANMDHSQTIKLESTFLEDCKDFFQKHAQHSNVINKSTEIYELSMEFLTKYEDYLNKFKPTYSHIEDDEELLNIEPTDSSNITKESELLSEIYSRLALSHYTMVQYNFLMKGESRNHEPGLVLSRKSLQQSPNNKLALHYYTIIVGIVADTSSSVKQKVQLGHYYHVASLKLIKYHPDEPTVYHLLARFQFNVCMLSWIEKKIAGALLGKLPETSLAEVEANLLKTEEKKPSWPTNHLYLAKCLISQKRFDEASKWVNLGLENKPEHASVQLDINELKELKKKYRF